MTLPDLPTFRNLAKKGNLVPLVHRMMSDQLTPVLAYRRLVSPDDRTAPSFLLESVEGSGNGGRYSFLGSQPAIEVIAYGHEVTVIDNLRGTSTTSHEDDPLSVPARITGSWKPAGPSPVSGPGRTAPFTGGWVGYVGYDTARFAEPDKLPFTAAPPDDRHLPDMHLGLYRTVAIFDHVDKVLYAVCHVLVDEHATVDAAWKRGHSELDDFVRRLMTHTVPLPTAAIDLDLAAPPSAPQASNFERAEFEAAVDRCKAYIGAGDAFQIVLSQRFERHTTADPFEIYRALRVVNPSPYMIYLQAAGAILVGAQRDFCRQWKNQLEVSVPGNHFLQEDSPDEIGAALAAWRHDWRKAT